MKILWDSDRPLAKHEILALVENEKWNDGYIKKTLTVLLSKGAIEVAGKVRVGKKYSRVYVPTMSEDNYIIKHYPVRSFNIFSGLVGRLYENSDNEEKEKLIKELEEIVNELRESDE